jgi:cobalt/nickel transport system permease protein
LRRGLLASFLNGLAEVLETFSVERKNREGLPDSRALLISLTALTVAVSFSRGVYPPLVSLATTVLLATVLGVRLRNLAKATMAISLFVLAVTLPMALYQTLLNRSSPSDPIALLWSIAPLLLRCIAATSVLVLMAQSLGLTGLITGLRGLRVPPRALFALTLFLRYVPIMLRDATRLLSAREARIVTNSNEIKGSWFVLSTVAGSLLIKGFERAYRLQMALRARGLDLDFAPTPEAKAGLPDFIFAALSIALACLLVLM